MGSDLVMGSTVPAAAGAAGLLSPHEEKQTSIRGLRVYVAGPLRLGDERENLWRALAAAEALLRAGHIPYVPHLNAIWHSVFPRPDEEWIAAIDLPWLRLCDAVVRLPGESAGADLEVAEAVRRGIAVYDGVEELVHG